MGASPALLVDFPLSPVQAGERTDAGAETTGQEL